MRAARGWTSILSLLVTCAACGGDPIAPEPGPGPTPAVGDTLLSGDPAANALASVRGKAPSAAPESDRNGRFLRSRLDAVLRPAATVGEVNGALLAAGARISSSRAGLPFVTLRIAPVADEAAARAVGAQLTASGAFLFAEPAFQMDVDVQILPPSGDAGIEHFVAARLPAAWNLKPLAGVAVPVLLPDRYYTLTPPAELGALSFAPGLAGMVDQELKDGSYPGNHGYHVAGIIAAAHDDSPASGAHPRPTLLQVGGIPIGGLTMSEGLDEIVARFPPTGSFLLSTSLGFPDEVLTPLGRLQRAWMALKWRILVANDAQRFLHLTAAGNAGSAPPPRNQALWGSQWTVASRIADLHEVLEGDPPPAVLTAAFEVLWQWAVLTTPTATAALPNVLIVGSSGIAGTQSWFSNLAPDVRAVGEQVFSTCVAADPGFPANGTLCNGNFARYSGTSMATPLVAGIGAYLWSMQPALTVVQLRDILVRSYDAAETAGVLDGYQAVLRLDQGLGTATYRRELLDVASSPGTAGSDGTFDQDDLALFRARFTEYEEARDAAGTPEARDFSRFDLNGEGITGGGFETKFDLDADGQFGVVSLSLDGTTRQFNEGALNDLAILCYYAWSPLYEGTSAPRAAVLGAPCGVQELTFESYGRTELEMNDYGAQSCAFSQDDGGPGFLALGGGRFCAISGHTANMTYEAENAGVGVGSLRSRTVGEFVSNGIEARANADQTLNFVDYIVIDAPGLTGTQGTLRFSVTLTTFTTVQAVPCAWGGVDSARTASAHAVVNIAMGAEGALLQGGSRTCPMAPQPPGGVTQFVSQPIPFTYGQRLAVLGSSHVSTETDYWHRLGDEGVTIAEAKASWSWGGLLDLPPEATVRSGSGYDWKGATAATTVVVRRKEGT